MGEGINRVADHITTTHSPLNRNCFFPRHLLRKTPVPGIHALHQCIPSTPKNTEQFNILRHTLVGPNWDLYQRHCYSVIHHPAGKHLGSKYNQYTA